MDLGRLKGYQTFREDNCLVLWHAKNIQFATVRLANLCILFCIENCVQLVCFSVGIVYRSGKQLAVRIYKFLCIFVGFSAVSNVIKLGKVRQADIISRSWI